MKLGQVDVVALASQVGQLEEQVARVQNELKNESLRSAQQFEQINGELKEAEEKLGSLADDLAKADNSKDSAKAKKKSSTTDAVSSKEVARLVDARIDELQKKGKLGKGSGDQLGDKLKK